MSDLYPPAPHLSAFVLPSGPIAGALKGGLEVLESAGCVVSDEVLVHPGSATFQTASEVEREVIRHGGHLRALIDSSSSVLRIGLRHRKLGHVSLGVAGGAGTDVLPLEVAVHAGPLSLPVEIWSRQDRQNSKYVMSWLERVLVTLASSTGAAYGAIGIESEFPTPRILKSVACTSLRRPFTWYWSHSVGRTISTEERQLLELLDNNSVSRLPSGTVFRSWRPSDRLEADEIGVGRVVEFLSAYFDRR